MFEYFFKFSITFFITELIEFGENRLDKTKLFELSLSSPLIKGDLSKQQKRER